ncbi:MAG: hypothetical protein QM698_04305 [Micropepsaceae bacterium]
MSDQIDRLSRRRRILLATYGVAFIAFQASLFAGLDAPFSTWRPVTYALAAAWVGWSGTLIYVLATGGLLFRGRDEKTRAALNDELTSANRVVAYRCGYWMLMGSIVVFYALSLVVDVSLNEALRLLFAFGVATPAMIFAGRERRQGV